MTADEIRGYRQALGMTQQEFAEYLRVGVASVKRWEAGLIQDAAMDELLRCKCDRGHCMTTLQGLAVR